MKATIYNAAASRRLWPHAQLPAPLPSLDPGSEEFAAAVEVYQRTHGLIPDGQLGPVTWARMQRDATPVPAPVNVLGIDVSAWQKKPIDWKAVAAFGVRFAIIKATEDERYTSPLYRAQVQGAHDAGIATGLYHFAQPEKGDSPEVEADRLLDALRTQPTDLPPTLDLEAHNGLGAEAIVAWAERFTARVREGRGRAPILYTYESFLRERAAALKGSPLLDLPLWIAKYSKAAPRVAPWGGWAIWQYTQKGVVPGIAGKVDLNRCTAATLAVLRGA